MLNHPLHAHALVLAMAGVIGHAAAAKGLPPMPVAMRAAGGAGWHPHGTVRRTPGGNAGFRRAALKRRNVIRNRRAHRG